MIRIVDTRAFESVCAQGWILKWASVLLRAPPLGAAHLFRARPSPTWTHTRRGLRSSEDLKGRFDFARHPEVLQPPKPTQF